MTLAQIVDDILLTVASVGQEKMFQLERRQVEYWVDLYRLILIRQDINDNSIIDPTYVSRQSIPVKLATDTKEEEAVNTVEVYISKDNLPKLPVLTGRFALLSVFKPFDNTGTMFYDILKNGIQIPVVDWLHTRYMAFDRYNINKNYATIRNKKLVLYLKHADLDPPVVPDSEFNVYCEMILCSPANYHTGDYEVDEVYFRDTDYPLPDEKIPRLKQLILANELQWVLPAKDTLQSSQMTKMEEKDMTNNPATLIQAGADLFDFN